MEIAPEVQAFLQSLLLSLLSIAVPVITYVVRQWLLARVAETRSRLSAEQLYALEAVVELLVKSAEQSGLTGRIKDEASAKRNYVIKRAYEELQRLGFTQIDLNLIADTVEAKINEGVHKGPPFALLASSIEPDDSDQ